MEGTSDMKFPITFLCLFAFGTLLAGTPDETVVITVNGKNIYQSDFIVTYEQLAGFYTQKYQKSLDEKEQKKINDIKGRINKDLLEFAIASILVEEEFCVDMKKLTNPVVVDVTKEPLNGYLAVTDKFVAMGNALDFYDAVKDKEQNPEKHVFDKMLVATCSYDEWLKLLKDEQLKKKIRRISMNAQKIKPGDISKAVKVANDLNDQFIKLEEEIIKKYGNIEKMIKNKLDKADIKIVDPQYSDLIKSIKKEAKLNIAFPDPKQMFFKYYDEFETITK